MLMTKIQGKSPKVTHTCACAAAWRSDCGGRLTALWQPAAGHHRMDLLLSTKASTSNLR